MYTNSPTNLNSVGSPVDRSRYREDLRRSADCTAGDDMETVYIWRLS